MTDSRKKPVAICVLSAPPARDFPQEWYALATADNFWMQWRLTVFLDLLRSLEIPISEPLHGLDIGCGNGVLRQQVEQATAWIVAGTDINRGSLEMNPALRGDCLLYDVSDLRPELRQRYDFLLLFDVIEHIADVATFLNQCLFHLKPGGWVFINVPALESMHSGYDEAAGHQRRYDRRLLRSTLQEAGLGIATIRYWGLSLVPLLAVRKVLLRVTPKEMIMRRGFSPPGRLADRCLKALMRVETSLLRSSPLGTSLMAAARKPREAKP